MGNVGKVNTKEQTLFRWRSSFVGEAHTKPQGVQKKTQSFAEENKLEEINNKVKEDNSISIHNHPTKKESKNYYSPNLKRIVENNNS